MQELAKLKMFFNLSRSFSTCIVNSKNYAVREAKFMKKMMKGEQSKRKWFPNAEKSARSTETSEKIRLPQNSRRNTVLNKVFMKYITDLLATGEVGPDIVGKGIEISRVSITSDFSRVNVFWLASDSSNADKSVEEALNKAAGPLRQELTKLRVVGIVPMIQFVRDKQYVREIEIDRRLAIADFGDDYTPTDPTLHLRSTPALDLKLPSEVWSDIEKLEIETIGPEPEFVEEPLPEMRNDTLGLDHARILTTIQNSMDKSRMAYQQRSLNIVNPLPDRVAEKSSAATEYLSLKEKNMVFTAFLNKREIEAKRRKKLEAKLIREAELMLIEEQNSTRDDDVSDTGDHSDYFQQK